MQVGGGGGGGGEWGNNVCVCDCEGWCVWGRGRIMNDVEVYVVCADVCVLRVRCEGSIAQN